MRDEVDDVVAAWQRVRPDLDVSPMQVHSRVHRLAAALDVARHRAYAEHGLAPHEFDVLAALRRAPDELTPGELAAATHVTSGTMTHRLSGLSRRGLVARRHDPRDGRQNLVALTGEGRQRVDAALQTLLGHEADAMAGLSARETTALVRALRSMLVGRQT